MNRIVVALMFCLLLAGESEISALTLTGTDTILTYHEYGFDFISQLACTTFTYSSGYNCNNHFNFYYDNSIGQFGLTVRSGYGIQAGNVNLDSIKTAPPDSSFKLFLNVDSIPQDSLSSYLGHSYIFKTGVDPRDASKYYAKIRIVGFRMIDSASHTIVMRFLWACNVDNARDLSTSGLDTFHFSNTAITPGPYKKQPNISAGQTVFKVVGDRFLVPKELFGSLAYYTVYNLNGKMLGRISISNKKVVDLTGIKRVAKGVLVVKVER
jgi:hypothetical protein